MHRAPFFAPALHPRPRRLIPPLSDRLADGRPVLTHEQAQTIMRQVMALTTVALSGVELTHRYRAVTRLARNRVRTTDDGESLRLGFHAAFDRGLVGAYIETNQIDDETIRALVLRVDALAKEMIGSREELRPMQHDQQDLFLPAKLWYDSSVDAMRSGREEAVPHIVSTIQGHGLQAAGALGLMARSRAVLTHDGITGFFEETDCEVSVTARPEDGSCSGWGGQAHRDWSKIDPGHIAANAADMAVRSRHPQAIEPGRRVAILSPEAVVQLMRYLVMHFEGSDSDNGFTGFSKAPGRPKGSRFLQRVFDPRITITLDPADPDGGFRAWHGGTEGAYANPRLTLIENGVLKNLTYTNTIIALGLGRPYSDLPHGLHLHGGDTTLEQMIAQCDEGIYVNRFSSIDLVDRQSGMITGVTRDGCFLVKHGKIDRPVKNFRFLTSPFFFLNNVIAIGPARRTAFGFTPFSYSEQAISTGDGTMFEWPRFPMIVPPLMVRDFNFNALIDAV